MLNGIYDAIKGYLTSRKTLNNEKQTHDRANKCLKNVCTCHKPTKKGIPAKLNQHIVGFYTAILFLGTKVS